MKTVRALLPAFCLGGFIVGVCPAQVPVVLVNGFQNACTATSDPSLTFGQLPQLLSDRTVLFFDACPYQTQSVEALGQFFGQFIAPYPQVDVIAHSLGGLIVRSYLSGKQPAGGFMPPANTRIRKFVLIGSPNFGSLVGIGSGAQLSSSTPGSQFIYDLATWNQGIDDLRETDAIAIIGSGGNLSEAGASEVSDGVVALSSASLGFSRPGLYTRVLPACHSQGVNCNASMELALVDSPSHPTWLIIQSFLSNTADWQTIGHAPSQDPLLSTSGGLLLAFKDGSNNFYTNVSQMYLGTPQTQLSHSIPTLFYGDFFPAGASTLHIEQTGTDIPVQVTVRAGGYLAFPVKFAPLISRVLPAAGAVNTLSIAAGSIISVYGAGLASSTVQAGSLPLPTQLGNSMLTANGQPLGLFYVSATQINAYLPANLSGLVQISVVTSTGGQHTTQVLLASAVPAIFTQDSSGTGVASVLHASGQPVTTANPALAGETVSMFLTGLGATYSSSG
ncbi:MAG TPA: IPT/TIG domain-containing protein, partial [Bryobacteraceae bacterium]|nr:IPT/TIG domain-containing protein [Bryobacteraceae bacterium]